jgi:hypothetical protein
MIYVDAVFKMLYLELSVMLRCEQYSSKVCRFSVFYLDGIGFGCTSLYTECVCVCVCVVYIEWVRFNVDPPNIQNDNRMNNNKREKLSFKKKRDRKISPENNNLLYGLGAGWVIVTVLSVASPLHPKNEGRRHINFTARFEDCLLENNFWGAVLLFPK